MSPDTQLKEVSPSEGRQEGCKGVTFGWCVVVMRTQWFLLTDFHPHLTSPSKCADLIIHKWNLLTHAVHNTNLPCSAPEVSRIENPKEWFHKIGSWLAICSANHGTYVHPHDGDRSGEVRRLHWLLCGVVIESHACADGPTNSAHFECSHMGPKTFKSCHTQNKFGALVISTFLKNWTS